MGHRGVGENRQTKLVSLQRALRLVSRGALVTTSVSCTVLSKRSRNEVNCWSLKGMTKMKKSEKEDGGEKREESVSSFSA